MYKQIEEYKFQDGIVFKVFEHIDGRAYVFTCHHLLGKDYLSREPGRFVSKPGSYKKIMSEIDKAPKKLTPVLYTDFSKMDRNDPLIKAMEKRRPYSSSDFVPKMMIPDLRKHSR